MKLTILACAAVCVCSFNGNAAITIIDRLSPSGINGDRDTPNVDVSTSGQYCYGYNLGGSSATDVTINGVLFKGILSTPSKQGGSNEHFEWRVGSGSSSGMIGTANPGSKTGYLPANSAARDALSADYQTLLEGGFSIASDSAAAAVFTLKGLQAGHTYMVQFWINDSRNPGRESTVRYLSDTGDTDVHVLRSDAANSNLGSCVTSTFTVTDDTTSVDFIFGNANYTNLNAFQLRDITSIPEPATATLAGLALLGLVVWRRR